MPKLFLYKARDANVVAILRRSKKRYEWQLIKWIIDEEKNDKFEMGQWLVGKMIHPRYSSISPDGKYFWYHYWEGAYGEDAVFSKLPNFTAEYYGRWNTYFQDCGFTEDGKGVMSLQDQFTKRRPTDLELVLRKDIHPNSFLPIGYLGLENYNYEFLNEEGKFEKDTELDSKLIDYNFDDLYEKHATFVDCKGRTITIKDGILYADGEVLLDTTNHKFIPVKPI